MRRRTRAAPDTPDDAQPGWMGRAIANVDGMPAWARPPFYGLFIVYALTAAKGGLLLVVALLVALARGPEVVLQVLWLFVAAGVAGFGGGVAFAIARPLLRRLGRAGVVLTCWLTVAAYLGGLLLLLGPGEGARRHWRASDPVFWGINAFVSILFGSVIAVLWLDLAPRAPRRWIQRAQRVTSRVQPPSNDP